MEVVKNSKNYTLIPCSSQSESLELQDQNETNMNSIREFNLLQMHLHRKVDSIISKFKSWMKFIDLIIHHGKLKKKIKTT